MPRVLVVEDDKDLSLIVCDKLLADKFEVEAVYTGTDAQERLKKDPQFDVLVLDWDLPGVKGPDIARAVRAEGKPVAILMLTGRTNLEEKEQGFDAGADDYLTKPFALKELGMRIKALARRAEQMVPPKPERRPGTIEPGHLLEGKYLVGELIGEGGMGLIYKATHTIMNRPVVIKVMKSHLMEDEKSLARFEQEQKILAQIVHPNVVSVFDVGLLDNKVPFIVMEYIHGESVYSLMAREGILTIQAAASILINVCNGLQAAHSLGIVHRDLKPENILLLADPNRTDWVKVVDFGTAILTSATHRLTEQNTVVGTAEYISPEQLRDQPVDGRADLYALGVILFYMLTKDAPYQASKTEALLLKIIMEAPDPISARRKDIPAGSPVEMIIDRALLKDPNQRYQSAEEMRYALESLL